MPSGTVIPAGGPPEAAPRPTRQDRAPGEPGAWRKYAITAGFLAPALVFLSVWLVYPTIRTVIRSFYDRSGDNFVGVDNYVDIFTTDILLTAIKNNILWVLVVPITITAIGVVFAVLTERIRWSVAFKTAVFMPMAISLFAAGLIWRIVYEQDPDRGVLNAAITSVRGIFVDDGQLAGAKPSGNELAARNGGVVLKDTVQPGDVALIGLTAIPTTEIPADATQAAKPQPRAGGINGVVWRDFKPGGGKQGEVEQQEVGLPGVDVTLTGASGDSVATTTAADGSFSFGDLSGGQYTVGIPHSEFAAPFQGYTWLGPRLITPAIMIAYIWVWAGFAMVVIGAGLAAIPRDVLEAARTDGASEWQVFRRVTVPLLAPVLSVVFITMLINVLKIFDIVLSVAPPSTQDDANVIALAMWRTSFGGVNNFGLGAAIAVFLFLLVIPILALNIRRFKREA